MPSLVNILQGVRKLNSTKDVDIGSGETAFFRQPGPDCLCRSRLSHSCRAPKVTCSCGRSCPASISRFVSSGQWIRFVTSTGSLSRRKLMLRSMRLLPFKKKKARVSVKLLGPHASFVAFVPFSSCSAGYGVCRAVVQTLYRQLKIAKIRKLPAATGVCAERLRQ